MTAEPLQTAENGIFGSSETRHSQLRRIEVFLPPVTQDAPSFEISATARRGSTSEPEPARNQHCESWCLLHPHRAWDVGDLACNTNKGIGSAPILWLARGWFLHISLQSRYFWEPCLLHCARPAKMADSFERLRLPSFESLRFSMDEKSTLDEVPLDSSSSCQVTETNVPHVSEPFPDAAKAEHSVEKDVEGQVPAADVVGIKPAPMKVSRSMRRGLLGRFTILAEVEEPKHYPNHTKWFITFVVAVTAAAAPLGSAIFFRRQTDCPIQCNFSLTSHSFSPTSI